MKAYLIALYTVIVLSIVGFIIGTLVFCFCDPRKAKEEENIALQSEMVHAREKHEVIFW